MEYGVVLADSAKADADSICERVVEAAPIRGPEWFQQLLDSLHSLKNLPIGNNDTGTHHRLRTDSACSLL